MHEEWKCQNVVTSSEQGRKETSPAHLTQEKGNAASLVSVVLPTHIKASHLVWQLTIAVECVGVRVVVRLVRWKARL